MKFKVILKSFLFISALVITISSCKQKPYGTIEGKVENLDTTTTISFQVREFSSSNEVESKKLTPTNNTFKFKLRNISEPTIAIIKVEGQRLNEIVLLIEPNEKTKVIIDAKQYTQYTVEGSEGSLLIKKLNNRLLVTKRSIDSLDKIMQLSNDNILKAKILQEQQAAIDSQRVFSTRFIWANPMSRASIVALYQQISSDKYVFDQIEDLQLFKIVASSQIALYPESSYAKGMANDINEMIQRIKKQKIQTFLKQTEQTLPDIALPNAKGNTVALSSLKGKVIILNFWASWNQESLLVNKELSNLVAEFKGKPVVIYNVSLDYDKKLWLNSIETTKMPGVHVCELVATKPTAALNYNITQLPANYVIDKNFDIIGKNVYGDALKQMLIELQ